MQAWDSTLVERREGKPSSRSKGWFPLSLDAAFVISYTLSQIVKCFDGMMMPSVAVWFPRPISHARPVTP